MRSNTKRRLLTLAVAVLLGTWSRAAAQGGNPVYVDHSPVAWELLQLARQQAIKNEGEAVRLYGELLAEHGRFLVPRQAAAEDEFVAVRGRAIADLRAREALLRRYQLMFTAEAQRRLDAGAGRDVAMTMPLTEPGLRAMLQAAQNDLESARFRAARSWLEEALEHPDLTAPQAAQCWFMLGLAAHYLQHDERRREAVTALGGLGADGRAERLELERLVASGPGPEIVRGATSLDRTVAIDLGELVAQTIWSSELATAPLSRLFADPSTPEAARPAGFELKRRQGDLTTVAVTVSGTSVYVNEGHTVRALDRFTGRSAWARPYRDSPRPTATGRDDTHAGDLSIVAVEGDTLVTLTGHAYASARSGGGKVLCLDARTGQRRWETTLDRIGDNRDYEGLFPHGAPIIAEGRVYVLARRVSPQMLTGCYVVALDRDTGGLDWIRLVASSGSKTKTARPFSTLVYDDGDLFVATAVGAIGSLDAARGMIHWLRRSSVPVHVPRRPRQPWEMGGAVVAGDRVIAITPDERRIVVLDRASGDKLEGHDAQGRDGWSTPAYLLAGPEHVYAVGSELRGFRRDALDRPRWRLPAPAQSRVEPRFPEAGGVAPPGAFDNPTLLSGGLNIVGRVQLVTDALLVPTLGGVLLVEADTGRVMHRLRLESSGNPLAVGAQLLVAGADSLSAYMSLTRAEQMLRERIVARPENPEPALSLVQLGMRVRDISLSLEAAELARRAIDRGAGGSSLAATRRELFNMLLEIHRRRIAQVPEEHEALYGMIGTIAATAEQRAEYLIVYGDGLAAWAPDRAVETYQSVLSQALLAATPRGEAGILRPAGAWAAERLGRLIDEHGPALYAPQADYARRSVAHQMTAGPDDDDAFGALAVEFPYAEASTDAALQAAQLRREQGDARGALTVLAAAMHLAPTAERSRRLLGAFVETCRDAFGAAHAADILAEIRGDPLLDTRRGPRRASAWRADLRGDAGPSRLPRIGVARGGDDVVEAGLLAGTLLLPSGSAGPRPPADRVLLAEADRLRLVEASALEVVWTTTLDDPETGLLQFDDDEVLLWVGGDSDDPRITALDSRTGRARWTTPRLSEQLVPPLARERGPESQMPDGTPFVPGQTLPLVERDAVYLVQRTGGVAAFDREHGGAWRWSAPRTLEQVHLALAHPFGLVVAGMDRPRRAGGELQPRIVVLDVASGRELHRLSPRSRTGVMWMEADPLGSLLCATPEGLELVDLAGGRRRWINVGFDGLETRRGWRAGDQVIVESRTGSLFTVRLEDGRISEVFDTDIRGNWEKDVLRDVYVEPERVIAHFRDRIARYDLDGRVLGADIVTDTRDYRWVVPADRRLVVVSQHDTRQERVRGASERQTQRYYRVYILTDSCRLDGEMIELPPLKKRLRRAAVIDGRLLLSTDTETLALAIPE